MSNFMHARVNCLVEFSHRTDIVLCDAEEVHQGNLLEDMLVESLRSTRATFSAKRLSPRRKLSSVASSDRSCSHQIRRCLKLCQVSSFRKPGERWGSNQGRVTFRSLICLPCFMPGCCSQYTFVRETVQMCQLLQQES